MSKEAYYFSHDSNARNDEKIIALRIKHDWKGYGIFWAIIEKMRESTNYMCIKDYNLIAFDLRVDSGLIKSIVEEFGLFVFTECGKYFYSERLRYSMDMKDSRSQKARENAEKRWGKCNSNATAMQLHKVGNAIKESKVNEIESKVNENGFFLVQEMHLVFTDLNKNYSFNQNLDFPALKTFAEFISGQKFRNENFTDLSQVEQLMILDEWKKVSAWYLSSACKKSLSNLAKWNIQEVFNSMRMTNDENYMDRKTNNLNKTAELAMQLINAKED